MSLFEKINKYLFCSKDITLGKEFPYKEQIVPGDFCRPMLTAESIDILISLTNLSSQERKAIGDDAFEIFILETALAPMVVLKFGEVFKTDFSINLCKMDKDFLNIWFNSENETMTIYLLEGANSEVKNVRYVPFKNMKYLKSLCKRQLDFSPQEVDQWIAMCNSRYTTADLMNNAKVHEYIQEVTLSL